MTYLPTSTLDAAREEMWQRVFATEKVEDWPLRDVLAPLAEVADYVCRIGDHTDSAHYQVSKAGPLVHSAMRVRANAFERFDSRRVGECADKMAEVLIALEASMAACLWTRARTGDEVYRSDADALRTALADLTSWVEGVTGHVTPDPED